MYMLIPNFLYPLAMKIQYNISSQGKWIMFYILP